MAIGGCLRALRRRRVSKDLALALLLLVLGAAIGDGGHAFVGGSGHGCGKTFEIAHRQGADPNAPAPDSSHLAADCPLCRLARTSSTAHAGRIVCSVAAGERFYPMLLAATPTTASRSHCVDPARAPPTRLSA